MPISTININSPRQNTRENNTGISDNIKLEFSSNIVAIKPVNKATKLRKVSNNFLERIFNNLNTNAINIQKEIHTVWLGNTKISNNEMTDSDFKDVIRIKDALCVKRKEKKLYPQTLRKNDLEKMAKYVNKPFIHYSGNCAILSACLHYNIHYRQDIYSVKNTKSPTVGLESTLVDRVIFGQKLKLSYFYSIDDVKNEVLRRYNLNKEDFSFIISAENYILPVIGECAHDFNAVIIQEKNKEPCVQFIDAWKTFNKLPTFGELKSYFPPSTLFFIRAYYENKQ
ncbi:T3SS effector cysteine hydrolase SpvD family protein [Providencia burhodogranariea]|uniref:Virulence protein SpvD n=1 Tax=Providencia burhodogranariea DSM 19968 TaxID=1141662 RepID=K8WNN7_9GAMM|nr:T3SS effector cysteine hydrolase SpvD family protein [Providencia burhodogranariea]EKT62223.1 virulence protein SpvD [Providencia burhodogranariea DSM 19968]